MERWNAGTVDRRNSGTADQPESTKINQINQNPKTRKGGDSIHNLKGGWC